MNNMNNATITKPFVSICTPTFNRRPFIPYLIKCVEQQTYPKDRIEWVIIDDGSDKIEDLVKDIPYVKYFACKKQLTLGKKRNIMHDKCSGDFIVYIDDDDYYPPERIQHAIETLQANPNALCAGSSEMHIYFDHIKTLYQCGPYGANHATAATFAFRKELLKHVKYDDNAAIAEEKHFLKNYTIPFVQLDTTKTILVFSHIHNSVDKKDIIANPNMYVKVSQKNITDFMKNTELYSFYAVELNSILRAYPLGKPEHKPETIKQINHLIEERKKILEPLQELQNKMTVQMNEMKASYEKVISNKEYLISVLLKQNKELKAKMKTNELSNDINNINNINNNNINI
jgi:glycosyltransferase involved in cell wall biosynthesis